MFDGIIHRIAYHKDEVETWFKRNVVGIDICISSPDKPRTLTIVNRIRRIRKIRGACLDLHKTDCIIPHGYEINLNPCYADILSTYRIALREKIVSCYLLSPSSKFIVISHNRFE